MHEIMKEVKSNSETADREIVITRILNAPRELVFKAWTDPKHLISWWGPNGFTNTFHEVNIKPGDVWRFTLHGPDNFPNLILFKEVLSQNDWFTSMAQARKMTLTNLMW
jgi:uncharacterized protein YndB with AHSA1/START domain